MTPLDALRILAVVVLVGCAIALLVAFPWLLLVPVLMAFGNGRPWFRS